MIPKKGRVLHCREDLVFEEGGHAEVVGVCMCLWVCGGGFRLHRRKSYLQLVRFTPEFRRSSARGNRVFLSPDYHRQRQFPFSWFGPSSRKGKKGKRLRCLILNVWQILEDIVWKYERQNISTFTEELSARLKFWWGQTRDVAEVGSRSPKVVNGDDKSHKRSKMMRLKLREKLVVWPGKWDWGHGRGLGDAREASVILHRDRESREKWDIKEVLMRTCGLLVYYFHKFGVGRLWKQKDTCFQCKPKWMSGPGSSCLFMHIFFLPKPTN